IRTDPQTRRMLSECMREVESVARAHRIALAEDVVADSMRTIDKLAPGGTTSLQRDIAEGRRSELDYWSGAVGRLGAERDVATPLHATIYHCLRPLELKARGELAFPQ